jgi:hypothetical protein
MTNAAFSPSLARPMDIYIGGVETNYSILCRCLSLLGEAYGKLARRCGSMEVRHAEGIFSERLTVVGQLNVYDSDCVLLLHDEDRK